MVISQSLIVAMEQFYVFKSKCIEVYCYCRCNYEKQWEFLSLFHDIFLMFKLDEVAIAKGSLFCV